MELCGLLPSQKALSSGGEGGGGGGDGGGSCEQLVPIKPSQQWLAKTFGEKIKNTPNTINVAKTALERKRVREVCVSIIVIVFFCI